MTTSKGDPSALRAMNRRTILNHLRRIGPVSRTKLAELTGLSPASITGVTAELIEDRWLIEQSIGEAGSNDKFLPMLVDRISPAHVIDLNEGKPVLGQQPSELSVRRSFVLPRW